MDSTSKKKLKSLIFLKLRSYSILNFIPPVFFSFCRKIILEPCSAISKITLWKHYFQNENSHFFSNSRSFGPSYRIGTFFFKLWRILPDFMWFFQILNNLNSSWDKLKKPKKVIFFKIEFFRNTTFSCEIWICFSWPNSLICVMCSDTFYTGAGCKF